MLLLDVRGAIDADTARGQAMSPFDLYRADVNRRPMISQERVRDLAEQIEQAKVAVADQRGSTKQRRLEEMRKQSREAEEARRELIEANLRLVLHVARRYRGLGLELTDLVQEGNIGLMHAIEKFDPRLGYHFSTYAIRWIRQYISRALVEQARTIRVPLYKVEELKHLARVKRQLREQDSHNEPTLSDVASQMGVSIEQVIALAATHREATSETLSLDRQEHGADERLSLVDMLEDMTSSPEQEVTAQMLSEDLNTVLCDLPEREEEVLRLRFGLPGRRRSKAQGVVLAHSNGTQEGKELSLLETAQRMNISHEAVRQVEMRALQHLFEKCQHLRVYLEV